MTTYRVAPEVQHVAEQIIADVPAHHALDGLRIVYLFIDPPPTSNGRTVWGRARRVGGLGAVLHNLDHHTAGLADPQPLYVVEISRAVWRGLSDAQRKALVDHELCHLDPEADEDGVIKYRTRGHDFEEFTAVIRRHGLWTSTSQRAGAAMAEQLAMAIDETISVLLGPDGTGTADPDED